jgi:hypothetical protein
LLLADQINFKNCKEALFKTQGIHQEVLNSEVNFEKTLSLYGFTVTFVAGCFAGLVVLKFFGF